MVAADPRDGGQAGRQAGQRARGLGPALAAAVAVASALTGLLGFLLGRSATMGELRRLIERSTHAATLGDVAGEQRAEFAQAFHDPQRAAREMDGYAWQVPNLPTPFVGSMPAPGRHGSADIGPDQFRGAAEVRSPKPPGTFRIFVTGGSTAFGVGAPSDADTVPGILQRLLEQELAATGRRYEVINAGNPGWSSTHERILIEERLSELEPDLVVSLSGNNEAHWGFLGFDVLWFRTYYDHFYAELLRRLFELAGEVPGRPRRLQGEEPVPPELVLARLEKNLRLAAHALEPSGATYVFALQPNLAASGKALSAREQRHLAEERLGPGCAAYFAACYGRFRAALPELRLPGLAYVDLAGIFDGRSAGEEIFLDSYHFGDRGNELLAARLLEALRPFLAD